MIRPVYLCVVLCAAFVLLASCDSSDSSQNTVDGDVEKSDVENGDTEASENETTSNEPDIPFVLDKDGGVLIFHGVNIESHSKHDPLRMPTITKEEVLRLSRDWGLNFARFLIFWDAIEPEPNKYDQKYLDLVEEKLDWFKEADVYVMLDMHQDVWSESTCGNGAPKWAVRHDNEPIECQPQWFANYLQPGVMRCFDNFWNYNGKHKDLQDHYANMWAEVVKRFKDHPAVIAYDIMNEPHPGSDFNALEALGVYVEDSKSPQYDKEKLQTFFQRVINKIREVDTEKWIGFQPKYGAPSNGMPSYFSKLTDPRKGAQRLIYTPHLYSARLEQSFKYDLAVDDTIVKWEKERQKEKSILGTPIVAGEWGLDPNVENSRIFMSQVLEMFDKNLSGWAYWSWDPGGWSFINPDLTERETINDIVRVYPQRIAGLPTEFLYNPQEKAFKLTYKDHDNINGETKIYIPKERFYKDGYELIVSDSEADWYENWDDEKSILSLEIKKTGGEHSIEIKPKK